MARIIVNVDLTRGETFDSQLSEIKTRLQSLGGSLPDYSKHAEQVRNLGEAYNTAAVNLKKWSESIQTVENRALNVSERMSAQSQAVKELGNSYSAATVQLSAFNGEMREQNSANQQNAEYARILAERYRQQAAAVRETASSYTSYTSAWASAKHANNEQETNILSLRKSYADFINQIVSVKDKYPKGTFDEMEQQARANSKALQGLSAAGRTTVSSNNQLATSLDESRTRFAEMREEVDKNADTLRQHNDSIDKLIVKFSKFELVAKLVMIPLQLIRKGLQDINDTMYETEEAALAIDRVLTEDIGLTQISDDLYRIAADYGQTFENASQIAINFVRTGRSWQESLEATRAAMVAMNVAELDAEDAASGLVAIMAQFKVPASDLYEIIAKINLAADRFPVDTPKIIDALERMGSAAVNTNISFEESVGLITALSEATGRQGSAIGTALNSLIQLTKKGLGAFEGLSDEMERTVRLYKLGAASIYDVWKQLSVDLKNLQGEQSELLDDLFSSDEGQEYLSEIQSQLGDVADTIGEVNGVASTYRQNWFIALTSNFETAEKTVALIEDAAAAQEHLNEEQAKYDDSIISSTNRLTDTWKMFANSLGREFWEPILRFLQDVASTVIAIVVTITNGIANIVHLIEIVGYVATDQYDRASEAFQKITDNGNEILNVWEIVLGIKEGTQGAADAAGDLADGYDAANAAAGNLEATAERIAEDNKAIADAIKDANSERKSANSLAKSAASVAKAQQSYEEAIVKARLKYQKSVLDGFKDALKQEDEYQKKLDQIQEKQDKVEEKKLKVEEKEVELAEKRLKLEEAIEKAKRDYLVEWVDDYFDAEDYLTDLADKQLAIAEAQADVEEAKKEALEAEGKASEDNLKTAEKELKVQQALADLEKAKSQRNVRVYDANGKWSWQASGSAVQSAQDKYDSALASLTDSGSKSVESAQKKVTTAEDKVTKAQKALDDWLKGTTAKELKEYIKENGLDTEGIHDIIAKWLSYGSTDLQTWGKDLETAINAKIEEQAYDDTDVVSEIQAVKTAEENVETATKAVGEAEEAVGTAISNLDTWLQEQAIADLKTKLEESNGNLSEQDIKDTLSAWLGKSVSQDAGLVQWGNALTSTFGAAIRSGYYDKSEVQSQLQSLSSAQASYADTLVDQMWSDVEDLYRNGKEEIAEDTLEAILNGYRAQGVSEDEINAIKDAIGSSASSGSVYSEKAGIPSLPHGGRGGKFEIVSDEVLKRYKKWLYDNNVNGVQSIYGSWEDYSTQLHLEGKDAAIRKSLSDGTYNKEFVFDSGGILNGLGGIKATTADEAVLDPNLTRKLLNPSSNAAFSRFASSLGILFGVADKIAKPSFSSSGGTTNNYANKSYNVNGVPIPQNAATQYSLAELCSMMTLNAN